VISNFSKNRAEAMQLAHSQRRHVYNITARNVAWHRTTQLQWVHTIHYGLYITSMITLITYRYIH